MRVLIVRFSAIGDCVMAAWAATALHHMDGVELSWAVQERPAPVLDRERLVQRVCLFPRETWKRAKSPTVWLEQARTYLGLRKFGFDVGIDLQGHSKTALCLRLSGSRRRWATRATDGIARRLNPVLDGVLNAEHEVERHLRGLQPLGEFRLPERPWMPALPAVPAGLPERFVSIQTGAGEADKRVPIEAWQQVAERLSVPVVWLGAPGDPSGAGEHDRVGRLGLRSSMAVVAASQVHLAGDTGTGHIASAYGVPVVSVFGRTEPARFRPWGPRVVALRGATPADVPVESIVLAAEALCAS